MARTKPRIMFTQLKNIDTAFKHIKNFSIMFLLANVLLTGFAIYKNMEVAAKSASRIHILFNGKVLEAFAAERKSYLPVELRDHINTFHEYFFELSPEDKAIKASVTKSLFLADASAKKQYDNLVESGYYNNLIAASISQEIEVDSTVLNIDVYPYLFTCYATEKLVRSSSTVFRKLVTKGQIRDLKKQTDENPHGFLIQNWEILENSDQPKLNP